MILFYFIGVIILFFLWRAYIQSLPPRGFKTQAPISDRIAALQSSSKPRKDYCQTGSLYSKKMDIPTEYDTIIVGSGIGGLATAAMLARVGQRVIVLEQHDRAGGSMHSFMYKGYEFDTGIHYVGDVVRLNDVLNEIVESPIDWCQLGSNEVATKPEKPVIGQMYDDTILPNGEHFQFKAGFNELYQTLVKKYPHEKKAIDKYFSIVKVCGEGMEEFAMSKVVKQPYMKWALRNFTRLKTVLKYAPRTVFDVVSEITQEPNLLVSLLMQCGCYGPPGPFDASFFMHTCVVNHYFEGGWFPCGGPTAITHQIVKCIENNGGLVMCKAPVKEIIVDGDTARGVRLENGKELFAPNIVSNVGARKTFNGLLPPNLGNPLSEIIKNIPPSTSAFWVFLGLDGSTDELKLVGNNLFIYPQSDPPVSPTDPVDPLKKFVDDPLHAPIPFFIAFPCAKDPSWKERHPNKSTVCLLATLGYDSFKEWEHEKGHHHSEEYKSLKNSLTERLVNEFIKYYPNLRDRIDVVCAGSPLTQRDFLGHPNGESYGLGATPERFACEILKPTVDSVKGLYLTGMDIVCNGFVGAMMAGVLTANCVLGYGSLPDIICNCNILEDLKRLSKREKGTKKTK